MKCKYQEGRFILMDVTSTFRTYITIDAPRELKFSGDLYFPICSYEVETESDRIKHINEFVDKFSAGERVDLGFIDNSGIESRIRCFGDVVSFHVNTGGNYWKSQQHAEMPFIACKDAILRFCYDCKDF